MLDFLLGNIWPLIAGALGLVAAFFGVTSKVNKVKRKEAEGRAERAEDIIKIDRMVENSDEEIDAKYDAIEREANEQMDRDELIRRIRARN